MTSFEEPFWAKEADIFSRYLIGEKPNNRVVELYIEAQRKLKISLKHREASQLKFILFFPWSVAMIDAALAILRPDYAVRKKIYTMFCILESSPEYHTYFLPQERKRNYMFTIILSGVRAILNTILGFLLVPWII